MEPLKLRLSQFVSYAFHPLLIPTATIVALLMMPDIYFFTIPGVLKLWYAVIVFVFTVLMPAVGVLFLKKLNAIQSFDMVERSERTVPMIVAGTGYVTMLYLLRVISIPPVFLFILYSATFSLIAGLVLNLFYKVSLHTLGWSALTSMLICISLRIGMPLMPFVIVSILINGLVGYARLKQNAHNEAQVYWGYVVGVGVIVVFSLLV